nr:hypothetical protein [Amycolatopsis sp. DSM 110486]
MRGDDNAIGVSGGTGQAARFPGQRFADDAGQEARRGGVGLARPHRHRHQPHGPATHEALARVVGHELLADELLHAVARLQARERRVVDVADRADRRVAAEHGQRAGEHQYRLRLETSRVFEQRTRAVEVGAHAEVEVGLGRAADHARQVEDRVDRAEPGQRGGEVAADHAHARVGDEVGRRREEVDENQFAEFFGGRAAERDRGREQPAGEDGAQGTRRRR